LIFAVGSWYHLLCVRWLRLMVIIEVLEEIRQAMGNRCKADADAPL
jgi:hypothetical protein